MIKILFIINALGGGGAERVLVNLVNYMDKNEFDITVETLFDGGINRRSLSPSVKYINKNPFKIKGLSKVIKFVNEKLLYSYYIGKNGKNYDIIVAYIHGIPVKIISGKKTDAKKVAWLHYGNVERGSFFNCWYDKEKAIKAYQNCTAIVGVSKDVTKAFINGTNIDKNKFFTLYNSNDTKIINEKSVEEPCIKLDPNCINIVTAGRLTPPKGYERLINIATKLHNDGFKFILNIMGHGPEKNNLSNLIKQNNAQKYIKLLGFIENPYAIMSKSSFYVLSSYREGLATVLTEALTVGLPVISTEVSGSKEVLGENNEYGLVVENSDDALYEGLKKFLTDEELLEKYRNSAKKRAEQFDTEHTVEKTQQFFRDLVN